LSGGDKIVAFGTIFADARGEKRSYGTSLRIIGIRSHHASAPWAKFCTWSDRNRWPLVNGVEAQPPHRRGSRYPRCDITTRHGQRDSVSRLGNILGWGNTASYPDCRATGVGGSGHDTLAAGRTRRTGQCLHVASRPTSAGGRGRSQSHLISCRHLPQI